MNTMSCTYVMLVEPEETAQDGNARESRKRTRSSMKGAEDELPDAETSGSKTPVCISPWFLSFRMCVCVCSVMESLLQVHKI